MGPLLRRSIFASSGKLGAKLPICLFVVFRIFRTCKGSARGRAAFVPGPGNSTSSCPERMRRAVGSCVWLSRTRISYVMRLQVRWSAIFSVSNTFASSRCGFWEEVDSNNAVSVVALRFLAAAASPHCSRLVVTFHLAAQENVDDDGRLA